MCGLVGASAEPGSAWPALSVGMMLPHILHRGPDDEGVHIDRERGLGMGHRRLSIIDLSAASHQPMVDLASGVVLGYNGELYNYGALRAELQGRGHQFTSCGDTEVVLRAYLEWGVESLPRFAGMFALAIWDPRVGVVHLARDALGMKPLYVMESRDGVAFASEVKAFRSLLGFEGRLDPQGLAQYLEFGYVPDTHRTSLLGVSKLAPGERWELAKGRVNRRVQWYQPPAPDPADQRQEEARVVELTATLTQVVSEHLVADVPVGLLLSGGLDSSVVAALAAGHGQLNTVSAGFEAAQLDERPSARAVATALGSNHHELLIRACDIRREAMEGAWVFDDLFDDWGTITSRILYRRCRELGIKVVLVGEGSDELFGGYSVFEGPRRLGMFGLFQTYRRYIGRRYGRQFMAFAGIMREYLSAGDGDAFHAIRLFETRRQLPNCYVMKVDKASMAESVEARAPFLDRRVADIAFRTPRDWLLRGGENKYLLRAVARRIGTLPREIPGRIKFGAPLAGSWMDDDAAFRAFARERLLAPGSQAQAMGFESILKAYFDRGQAGFPFPSAYSVLRNLVWRLLALELWAPHYLGPRG